MDAGKVWTRKFAPQGAEISSIHFAQLGVDRPAAPRLSFAVARAGTLVMVAGGFFVIHALLAALIGSSLAHDGQLSTVHAQVMAAVGLASACFFAGHGASIALLEGYVKGWFRLPPAPVPHAASIQRARNPWQVALVMLGVCGLASAAVSYWAIPVAWPSGVPLARFAWVFGLATAILSAGITASQAGERFLEQAHLAPAQRRFAGTQRAYLWQRHALPQGVINALLNGWVGVAIMPAAWHDPGATISAAFVQRDIFGTALVLALMLAVEVRSYASFDQRWGVVNALPLAKPRWGRVALWLAAIALVALLAPTLVSWTPLTFVLARAIGCGVYCALLSYGIS